MLTVPNLISSLRIVLIPVFVGLILDHDTSTAGLVLFGAVAATDYRDALAVTSEPATRVWLRTQLARALTYAGDIETAELVLAGLELDGGGNDAALLLARGIVAYFRHDFAAADEAADEARRRIGRGEGGSWRLFDLIALQGLLAHHRGEWFQRLRVELRSGIRRPDLVAGIFDSHLCVAEFLLYGPTPYADVLARLGREYRVFCGLEAFSLPMLAVGGSGVMNAVGNLAPDRVAALCQAVTSGKLAEARRLHDELFDLSQAIFLDTNPIPLKYMMTRMGLLPASDVRLPLVPITDDSRRSQLDAVLRRAGLLTASVSMVP